MNFFKCLTDFLWTSHKLLMNFLQTSYELLTNFLQIFYNFFTNFLQFFYKFFTNFFQTFYELFTNFLRTYDKFIQNLLSIILWTDYGDSLSMVPYSKSDSSFSKKIFISNSLRSDNKIFLRTFVNTHPR